MSRDSSTAELTDRDVEVLRLNFEQQVQNLRHMTQIDLQVFGGFITLQLTLGGYLAEHAQNLAFRPKVGVALIDASLGTLAIVLLVLSRLRRAEVVQTIRNLNTALGFEQDGRFLAKGKINASTRFRPWLPWYVAGVTVAVAGLMLILFGAPA